MAMLKWVDGHIQTEHPKKPKKITGTHFPEILGIHPYTTAFEAWCRCTRTFELPFEGNEYTHAGEVIEPKVDAYLRDEMFYNLITPEDKYGKDFFKRTWGDFFPEEPIFGGMWDALVLDDETNNPDTVVEIKTVLADGHSGGFENRWKDGKAPDYQALQASLYAYLLGIENVMVVGVPLYREKGDYEHPENVKVGFGEGNLWIDEFNVYERYPDFDTYIEKAEAFWRNQVLTGISPQYDEKKDAEILKELRKVVVDKDAENLEDILAEAEALKAEIDAVKESIAEKEKRLKVLTEFFKTDSMKHLEEPGITSVDITGSRYRFTVCKSEKKTVDTAKLKKDGLYDKYLKAESVITLRVKELKEEE